MRRTAFLMMALALSTGARADGLRQVSSEGRLVEYEGSLTLAGRFERRQDAETLVWQGDRVCFRPDAGSARLLPPAGGKAATRLLCFSNHRGALEQLHLAALPPAGSCGTAGPATVVVTRYTVEQGDNTFDQAWLDRVERAGPVTPLACP
jgi:hypothetical protein